MKSFWCFFAMAVLCSSNGCVQQKTDSTAASVLSLPQVVREQKDSNTVLSCLKEIQPITRAEFKTAFTEVTKQGEDGQYGDSLRVTCLSLHEYASYKQFKIGIDALEGYIKEHPADAKGLSGLQVLMQRMDKDMILKWSQHNKNTDEKEALEAQNKELLDRNVLLEKNAEQDQTRIKELQKQIEQLKNIENIIKNRER